MIRDKDGVVVDSPVHVAFGLTYASYFCVPRMVLERMPLEWQKQFVALVEQLPPSLPTYTCKRRDAAGRFIHDPLAEYRHGSLPAEIAAEMPDVDT